MYKYTLVQNMRLCVIKNIILMTIQQDCIFTINMNGVPASMTIAPHSKKWHHDTNG